MLARVGREERLNTAPLLEVNGVTLRYKTPNNHVTATYRVYFLCLLGYRFILL